MGTVDRKKMKQLDVKDYSSKINRDQNRSCLLDFLDSKRTQKTFRQFAAKIATSGILSVLLLSGVSERAFAGSCTEISTGNYVCSGMETPTGDASQFLLVPDPDSDLTVVTEPDFGLYNPLGPPLVLMNGSGSGGIHFQDQHESSTVGENGGLIVLSFGSGDALIELTGTLTAKNPISGAGAPFDGHGNAYFGLGSVDVFGLGATGNAGDFRLVAEENSVISGHTGYHVLNAGSGSVHFESAGNVIGFNEYGLIIENSEYSGGLTVDVNNIFSGLNSGVVYVESYSDHDVKVTVSGTASGGLFGVAAFAEENATNGENTVIDVHVNNVTSQAAHGIWLRNADGDGGLNYVTVTGDVIGGTNSGSAGIRIESKSSDISYITL